jgi:hypothetical protein
MTTGRSTPSTVKVIVTTSAHAGALNSMQRHRIASQADLAMDPVREATAWNAVPRQRPAANAGKKALGLFMTSTCGKNRFRTGPAMQDAGRAGRPH